MLGDGNPAVLVAVVTPEPYRLLSGGGGRLRQVVRYTGAAWKCHKQVLEYGQVCGYCGGCHGQVLQSTGGCYKQAL